MKSLTITLSMLMLLPCVVACQAQTDSALVVLLQDAKLHGRYVRIDAGNLAVGRISDVTNETVYLPGYRISIKEIQRMDARSTHGGGALTGAVVGTSLMSLFILGLIAEFEHINVPTAVGSVLLGAAIGVPIGGIAGRLARAPIVEWRVVWPK